MKGTVLTIHLLISGRVQGVGYRESLHLVADALGLKGWVRNLEDGRVEAVLQGDEAALEQAQEWCRNGPPQANVKYVETQWLTSSETFTTFARRPDERSRDQ